MSISNRIPDARLSIDAELHFHNGSFLRTVHLQKLYHFNLKKNFTTLTFPLRLRVDNMRVDLGLHTIHIL